MPRKRLNLGHLYWTVFVAFAIFKIVRAVLEDPCNNSINGTEPLVNQESANNDSLLQSNDARNVSFYLYPNQQDFLDVEEIILGDTESLKNSRYNKSNQILIFIHGFLNNYTTRYSQNMKNAFLKQGFSATHNIITLDWGKLATPLDFTTWLLNHVKDPAQDKYYMSAVANVPKVGYRIAEFVMFLMTEKYLESLSDVHIIGFSLGAHVSGFAGKYLKNATSTSVGRITGLDAASPLFQHVSNEKKLAVTDAKFVDVTHSNQGQDGYYGNIGSIDYYPNGGGPKQLDCVDSIGVDVVTNSITGSCAHNRAWIYYIKALSEKYIACKCLTNADILCKAFCTTKAQFGYYIEMNPPPPPGSYYFEITSKDIE